MPGILDSYRQYLASTGQKDERPDYDIIQELGQGLEKDNPDLLKSDPDFAQSYYDIREANRPTLPEEFGRALKSGTEGLASTALGGAALLTGSDYLKGKAKALDDMATENGPTIPALENIAPEKSGMDRVLSRDAARYAISKIGSVAPSIAESVATSAIGAVAGSALGPEGTLAGAAGGFFEKGLVKAAIKSLLAKGEAATAANVAKEAAAIGAFRGGVAANAAGSLLLNSGDVASEGADKGTTIALGIVSALPDTILPAYVLSKLFKGVPKAAAVEAGKTWLARNGKTIAEAVGVPVEEFGQEAFQQAANVIARNVKDGKDPLDFSSDNWKELREAGIAGAAGGLLAAPGVILAGHGGETKPPPPNLRKKMADAALVGETVPPVVPAAPVDAPEAPVPVVIPAARRIALMTPEQQQARFTELSALPTPTVDEQQELEALRAFVDEPAPPAAPPAAPESPLAPPEVAPAPALPVEAPAAITPEAPVAEPAAPVVAGAPAEPALKPLPEGTQFLYEQGGVRYYQMPDAESARGSRTVDEATLRNEGFDLTQLPAAPSAVEPAAPVVPVEPVAAALESPLAPPAGEAVVAAPIQPEILPAPAPGIASSRAKIAAQTKVVKDLAAKAEQVADTNPKLARSLRKQIAAEQEKLTALVAAKQSGPAPIVGMSPTGEPDLLTDIAEHVGTIQTVAPKGASAAGGEFDGWGVLNSGAARMLRGAESGMAGDQALEIVNSIGPYKFNGIGEFQAAIEKAAQARKTDAERIKLETYQQAVEGAALADGARNITQKPKGPVPVEDIGVGGTFKIRGEKFSIVDTDEGPGGIVMYVVQDGHRFSVPEGHPFFADRGTIKQGEVLPKSAPLAGAAVTPADPLAPLPENSIPESDMPFNLASEQQPDINAQAQEQAERDAAQKALDDAQDELPFVSQASDQPHPAVEANHAQQFAAAAARIAQAGSKVDVFADTFLRTSLAEELNRRIDNLVERYASTPEAEQPTIQKQIEQLQAKIESLGQVRGVTYSPFHIAVGLKNLSQSNLSDLVVLLHEGAHGILGQNPQMRNRVIKAVNAAFSDLSAQLEARQKESGFSEVINGDPEELVVSNISQKLAAEGVPESSSVARAIWQWMKDLYYRVAMGIQASFGREPNPQMALDWFENQMRRVVGGDYDYRFAHLLDRFTAEPIHITAKRHDVIGGTPGGMTNFFDSVVQGIRQPTVLPDSTEAIDWNLKYATQNATTNPGQELDIPHTEAMARIHGASLKELSTLADEMHAEAAKGRPDLTFDQWWTEVHGRQTPQQLLEAVGQQVPGAETAEIGGEKMTDPMNQQARVGAKALLLKWLGTVAEKDARAEESSAKAERGLLDAASRVNKVEAELRDATMHEATLSADLKQSIKDLVKSYRRGLDTAFKSGELAHAIEEAEGLTANDGLPPHYQKFFERVLADEVPIFDYVDAVAALDLPLQGMTPAEIRESIESNAASDPVLGRLTEDKNKPLFVALSALLKKNADQVDMLQLRRADQAQFLAVHGELNDIRKATTAQLRELEKKFKADKKAGTYADRLKRSFVDKRAKLRRLQETIQTAETRRESLAAARAGVTAKIDEMETSGLPAPAEWFPNEGEKYFAMQQDDAGHWRSTERTLRFTPEGPAVNAEQLASDMVANRQYLKDPANEKRRGSKTYQMVERQTGAISDIDFQQTYPESRRVLIEKVLMDPGSLIMTGGGQGAAIANEMLKKFQFISFSKYHSDIEVPAQLWSNRLAELSKMAGMKDVRQFLDRVYEPVLSKLETEPGLEDGPALREAVRAARRRIGGDVDPAFDEQFKSFLRQTKALSETFVKIAEDNGVFVKDDRLGGELRKAVDRGWLTVMRRMDTATISTVLTEMDRAGWRLAFKDAEGNRSTQTFEQGTKGAKKLSVAGSTTFDKLLPGMAEDEQDRAAREAVMENPELLNKALSGFFTPGIVQRWLEPFVNKPGEPLFRHEGQTIDQLDVQQAWQDAGGNIVDWIDRLGQKVGLNGEESEDEEGDAPAAHGGSPEARWRADMLHQIEGLYVMESGMAAKSNQVKNLFDPEGKPAHLLMDARENDLLPPEHVQHMTFDKVNSKNLLATLAFHAAFGRNGEAMTKAINSTMGNLSARKAAFDSITSEHNTRAGREAAAQEQGYTYKDLDRAAKVYRQVEVGRDTLTAAFGFGNQAGALGDVRGPLELLHFIANQTTNNPKTGLLNVLQVFQRAIARRSLGAVTVRDTGRAVNEGVKQVMGGFLENFGLHLLRASQHAKDIGAVQGQAFGSLPWTEVFGAGSMMGKRGEEMSGPIKSMRLLQAAQRKGARIGFGESREFQRQGNIPFVSNMMQYMGMVAANANATAEATSIESMVDSAVKYFAANPGDMRNPTFRLTAKDLGMHDKAWFASEADFQHFRRKLVEYGIGNLEQVAREAADRQTKGQPLLTKDQVIKAAVMSGNELDLQGSINTNPAAFGTGTGLRFITPLLGWPIRQMAQVHNAMREADGRFTYLAAAKALGILAMWSLPVGLAFTMLTDIYDDKILKKKSNLGNIDPLAALPVVGPALALANSDNPMQQLQSMGVRLSRAGNIYGMGADAASTLLSGMDPTSGQRQFSLDSRILAFSQIGNIIQALNNWAGSGFATTWANVEKPLLQSMGGNGALHAIDMANGILGIDNQEARMTARTNAGQWLRAAGQEVGIEIRRSSGGSTSTTPMGAWTREMTLAALANDRLEFLDAYRKAVAAAKEQGKDDPEQAVLESFRSRNPIEVFARKPTPDELQQALGAMSESGRQAVTDALRAFNAYEQLISPSDFEVRMDRTRASQKAAITRARGGSASLRRQMSERALVP